jgi:hypothetical protein
MGAIEREPLPADPVRARSRFQAWQGRRKIGERIPAALWAQATRLAKVHGVSRTATALGVDHYGLKKRAGVALPPSSEPAFVEWPSSVMVGKQCQLELDNGAGATMRASTALSANQAIGPTRKK